MAGTGADHLAGLYGQLTKLVKARPCVVCGVCPTQFAHVTGVAGKTHTALRRRQGLSLLYGVPLCWEHHLGTSGLDDTSQAQFSLTHWGDENALTRLATRETLMALAQTVIGGM